jgi:hypothetical protein
VFNLWNPALTEEGCELDVTRANAPNFNQGSAELTRAFLDAWGIAGEVEGWSVERVRTSYFSDDLDSDDWRDRWQRSWILRARGRLTRTKDGPYEILQFVSAIDPTADPDEEDGPERCRALVIVGSREARETLDAVTIPKLVAVAAAHGFPAGRIELRVRQAAAGRARADQEEMRAWLSSPPFTTATGPAPSAASTLAKMDRVLNPLFQIRMLLADVDFPEQEPTLTELCASLKRDGLFVHRHALEFDALTPMG